MSDKHEERLAKMIALALNASIAQEIIVNGAEIEALKAKLKRNREALVLAKKALEDMSICVGGDGIQRCFYCEEFMDQAVWPEHGNPKCSVAKVLKQIEAALSQDGRG